MLWEHPKDGRKGGDTDRRGALEPIVRGGLQGAGGAGALRRGAGPGRRVALWGAGPGCAPSANGRHPCSVCQVLSGT